MASLLGTIVTSTNVNASTYGWLGLSNLDGMHSFYSPVSTPPKIVTMSLICGHITLKRGNQKKMNSRGDLKSSCDRYSACGSTPGSTY